MLEIQKSEMIRTLWLLLYLLHIFTHYPTDSKSALKKGNYLTWNYIVDNEKGKYIVQTKRRKPQKYTKGRMY